MSNPKFPTLGGRAVERVAVMLGLAIVLAAPPARAELVLISKTGDPGTRAQAIDSAELVEDYGAFAVYDVKAGPPSALGVSNGGWGRLPSAESIELEGGSIDTSMTSSDLGRSAAPSQPGPMLRLIQFHGPIKSEWLEELRAIGVRPIQYLPNYAYLVVVPSEAGDAIRGVSAVRWTGPYGAELKIQPRLAERIVEVNERARRAAADGAKGRTSLRVAVQWVELDPPREATRGQIESLRGRVISVSSRGAFMSAELEVEAASVGPLTQLPGVFWIEAAPDRVLFGERAAQIVSGAISSILPPGMACPVPGYPDFLASIGLSGADMVISLIDSGIDQGIATGEPGTAHPDLLGRIAGVDNATADATGGDAGGHGTINAGILIGNASLGRLSADGFLLGQGIAPAASVFATKIFGKDGEFDLGDQSLDQIVARASRAGASLSNNSWGAEVFGDYNVDSQLFDMLARDADPGSGVNTPFLAIFASGNAGGLRNEGVRTLASPATAKNVIAVGASENCGATGTDGCGFGPGDADSVDDLAGFSSRGPTDDGRLGVTIVAPGVHVQGTASTDSGYLGDSVCDPFFPLGQIDYARSSGTSHAAPLVTGAAALFAESFSRLKGALPSPALTRAALVAAADDIAGGDDGFGNPIAHRPSPDQGWGRLNMGRLLAEPSRWFLRDAEPVPDFIATGQEQTFLITPLDPAKPLKIALAWTDTPAAVFAGITLVNDLDLIVEGASSTFLGNVMAGGASIPGGFADRRNNLEAVIIDQPTGAYLVTVRATNLGGDGVPGNAELTDQDFALAVYNGTDQTSAGVVSFTLPVYACASEATVQLNDRDLRGAGVQTVLVTSDIGDSEPLTLTESTPGSGFFIGAVTLESGAPAADGKLQVAAGGLIEAIYVDQDSGSGSGALARAAAAIDCTGPDILDVRIDEISFDQFTVSWKTGESATASIGVGQSLGALIPRQATTAPSEDHAVTLTGLDSCTVYLLKIVAKDRAGNTAVASGPALRARTLALTTIFQDSLEPPLAEGWTHGAITGEDDWAIVETEFASSPLRSWMSADGPIVKDAFLTMPPLDLPPGSFLFFRHTFEFEPGFDGGVLEISTDAGVTWFDLAGHIERGGYTSLLSGSFGNPLGGRPAWSGGKLGPMSRVRVNLDDFTGEQRRIRFRIGTDNSVPGAGWIIDDVEVARAQPCGEALGPVPPVILDPGDVIIGNLEPSNLATSAKFFVHPDAFDLREIAIDDATPADQIKWSFTERGLGGDDAGRIRINGVFGLDLGLGSGPIDPPGTKRIDQVDFDPERRDSNSSTLTFRNSELSPLGGGLESAPARDPIESQTSVITLFGSDGTTFSSRSIVVYTATGTSDSLSMVDSSQPVLFTDFGVSGDVGGQWIGGVASGQGSTSATASGLCMTAPPEGENQLFWVGPEGSIDLVDGAVYRLRVRVSSSQSGPDSIPLWTIAYDNFSTSGGGNTFGGEAWFLDVAGGAAGAGRPQAPREFEFYFAPNAVETAQWRGEVDFDSSAFAPVADATNDMRLLFRVLDFDSAGLLAANDHGTLCIERVLIERIAIDSLAVESVVYSPPISTATHAPQSFAQEHSGGAATINDVSASAFYRLASPDDRKTLLPFNQAEPELARQLYPILWAPNELLRGRIEISANFAGLGDPPGQSPDPVDAIALSFDTATSELGAVHWTTRGSPSNMQFAASPRPASRTGGAAQAYTAYFSTQNGTASATPGADRLRLTGDFFNTSALAGGPSGRDLFVVHSMRIEKMVRPD